MKPLSTTWEKSSGELSIFYFSHMIKLFFFRDKVSRIFNARQLSDYCPKVVKDRITRDKARKAKKQAEKSGRKGPRNCWKKKKGRRKCFEREAARCARKRALWPSNDPRHKDPCTQEERDAHFGKNWRWNTRNCAALDAFGEGKMCRREKRKRCIRRLTTTTSRGATISEAEAKQVCKRKEKNKKKSRGKKA